MLDPEGFEELRQSFRHNEHCGAAGALVVDIVVPVFNARLQVMRCLLSVALHTRTPFRLLIVNDGSTDPLLSKLFAQLALESGIVVVAHSENEGFVRSANAGMASSAVNDVALLNSDTQVTEGWLEKLAAVAASRSRVATVTPLTNNGTICSVPEPQRANAIPAGYDVDSFGRLIETTSFRLYPEAPTGVGFCLYVTRRALNETGLFDAAAFERGYGEENDFCQRAKRIGFVNLIADDTFVYHEGSASFGDPAALLERNLQVVAARHPGYFNEVSRFCAAHPLAAYHQHLKHALQVAAPQEQPVRMRVLHVLHQGGGTERHARELASLAGCDVSSYVLMSDGQSLRLDEYDRGKRIRRMEFPLLVPVKPGELHTRDYDKAFSTICWVLQIDLIHVHHLMNNDVAIADVANSLGIPYVVTLHDFYALCPTYTLLDPNDRVCDECSTGRCGPVAEACMKRLGKASSFLLEYQELTRAFLAGAKALLVPNMTVKQVFARRFPELSDAIHVIEHGHRDRRHWSPPQETQTGDTEPARLLNVAVIGGLDRHKGAGVLRRLLAENRSERLVFHFYGTTADVDVASLPRDYQVSLGHSRFVYHGPYDATGIVRRLVRDEIDVGLHLSIWPETFSYTLSEFVEASIPVIGGDIGAQGERIRRCRLGWVLRDIQEVGDVLALLRELSTYLPESAAPRRQWTAPRHFRRSRRCRRLIGACTIEAWRASL